MKKTLLTLLATAALAAPAMAQIVYIGGAVMNGDLETGLAPYTGIASSISTDQALSGTQSMKVDLTANNSEGQWKLLHTSLVVDRAVGPSGVVLDVEADVLAGNAFDAEMWVYIPAGTGLGTAPLASVQVNLEAGPSATGPFSAAGGYASSGNVDITGLAVNTWHKISFTDAILPVGTTHVQTRAWFLATTNTVNGKDASDAGTTAADWGLAGYSGAVYFDDFRVESVLPPDPAIIMCEDVRNADFETGSLTPWSVQSGAGSLGVAPTDPVHSGAYSLGFEVAVNGDTNRWKQFNNVATGQVTAGDRIDGQVWIYIPMGTVVDPSRGRFSFQIRSDNGNAGNGRIGQHFFDIRPGNAQRDVWIPFTWQDTAVDGVNPITTVNTGGWFLETQDLNHANQANYSGPVFLDDFKLVNVGPALPGVLVDDTTNNGDAEDASTTPWNVSEASSVSTAQNHTPGGSQSIKVDLTKNNSNSQWKGLHNASISHPIENYTRADVSAWVYIPSELNGTKFGGTAKVNLSTRDGAISTPDGPTLDLTTAVRDTWVKIEALDIDVSGYATSLAVNNMNIETVLLLGPMGSTVRSDGRDGSADSTDVPVAGTADLDGPAVAQDWIDAGYEGCIFLDDIDIRLHTPVISDPIVVNSITYDGTDAVISYDTSFAAGVDVYWSDDLVNWNNGSPAFETATGPGLTTTQGSASPGRYYVLVEPGGTPSFGNFPPAP